MFLGRADNHGLAPVDVTPTAPGAVPAVARGPGYARATISRRFLTLATFYKYAVVDGYLEQDPAKLVGRPKVPWESQRRTVLHPL